MLEHACSFQQYLLAGEVGHKAVDLQHTTSLSQDCVCKALQQVPLGPKTVTQQAEAMTAAKAGCWYPCASSGALGCWLRHLLKTQQPVKEASFVPKLEGLLLVWMLRRKLCSSGSGFRSIFQRCATEGEAAAAEALIIRLFWHLSGQFRPNCACL